jgi:hypothetical protein
VYFERDQYLPIFLKIDDSKEETQVLLSETLTLEDMYHYLLDKFGTQGSSDIKLEI